MNNSETGLNGLDGFGVRDRGGDREALHHSLGIVLVGVFTYWPMAMAIPIDQWTQLHLLTNGLGYTYWPMTMAIPIDQQPWLYLLTTGLGYTYWPMTMVIPKTNDYGYIIWPMESAISIDQWNRLYLLTNDHWYAYQMTNDLLPFLPLLKSGLICNADVEGGPEEKKKQAVAFSMFGVSMPVIITAIITGLGPIPLNFLLKLTAPSSEEKIKSLFSELPVHIKKHFKKNKVYWGSIAYAKQQVWVRE